MAIVWLAVALAVYVVATIFHLPERMNCDGYGKSMHCEHGLLSPEVWR